MAVSVSVSVSDIFVSSGFPSSLKEFSSYLHLFGNLSVFFVCGFLSLVIFEWRRRRMRTKKELLSSAPWRGVEEETEEKFKDGKLKVTNQPGGESTMYVPGKKSASSKSTKDNDKDSLSEIDPELKYTFQRNTQFLQRVFSIDTIVKPLPPALSNNVSRNMSFFTRIFTQFFDPEGISNAQKSLGLGQEEKVRRVR